MYGRYGTDELCLCLLVVGLATALLSAIFNSSVLHFVSLISYFFCIYRSLSKNILKRQKENAFFLEKTIPLRRWGKLQKKRFADRENYRYFACPKCRQQVRVPKGKGKIRIICPKCREEFIRKS